MSIQSIMLLIESMTLSSMIDDEIGMLNGRFLYVSYQRVGVFYCLKSWLLESKTLILEPLHLEINIRLFKRYIKGLS